MDRFFCECAAGRGNGRPGRRTSRAARLIGRIRVSIDITIGRGAIVYRSDHHRALAGERFGNPVHGAPLAGDRQPRGLTVITVMGQWISFQEPDDWNRLGFITIAGYHGHLDKVKATRSSAAVLISGARAVVLPGLPGDSHIAGGSGGGRIKSGHNNESTQKDNNWRFGPN